MIRVLLMALMVTAVLSSISSDHTTDRVHDMDAVAAQEQQLNNVEACLADGCANEETKQNIADSLIHYNEDQQNIGSETIVTITEPRTSEIAQSELDDDVSVLFDKAETEIGEPDLPAATVPRLYEYPRLSRVEPGNVGDAVDVELEEGVFYRRITKAVKPPVFEIPGYLSDEECEQIQQAAVGAGLEESQLFGEDMKDQYAENRETSELSRISDQTWLREPDLGTDMWRTLQRRVASLTKLDIGVIQGSEPMQVVRYGPRGHYHAHIDSTVVEPGTNGPPCCFQMRCGDKENTIQWTECCRMCRYVTVLYFLADVDVGGETAFPLADMEEDLYQQKLKQAGTDLWHNLSYFCHNSSLVVPPKRGTAIMWYNHHLDDQTGYLGAADPQSHHGGCDIKKGTKWIANHWISAPSYEERLRQSVWT